MLPGIGLPELVVIGVVAVLLFGQRLPAVARNVGRSYQEFRRSLSDLKSSINWDDVDESPHPDSTGNHSASSSYNALDDYDEPTAPKLTPPKSTPPVDKTV